VNNHLAWINTPHGRIINKESTAGGFNLVKEYHLRDHTSTSLSTGLGNTRLVLEETGSDSYTTTHIADYYPFGMEIQRGFGHNQPPPGNLLNNRYLYNGKEYQDDFGLNWYDYGARFYDAQIARWHSIDPHAENYLPVSPYAYVANNPIIFIDPDGRDLWHINERGEIVHHDPDYTDADKFVIVSYDSEGNVVESQSITFEYETVTAVRTPKEPLPDDPDHQMTLFEISGDNNADRLFQFFADPDNTIVEWTDAKIGTDESGRNIVGTSHQEGRTRVGGYLFDTGYTLREVNHNHPNRTLPSQVDIDNAAAYQRKFPNIRLNVYIHNWGYIEYNKNTPYRPGRIP